MKFSYSVVKSSFTPHRIELSYVFFEGLIPQVLY